jgi:hypothetical protein
MDLSSLKVATDATPLEIVNPATGLVLTNDTGEPMRLLVIGTDSDVYLKFANEQMNKRLKKAATNRKLTITAEEADAEALARTAVCVVGFENLQLNGQPLEYSKQAVTDLLRDYPPIREQVEDFVNDRTNFLKQS